MPKYRIYSSQLHSHYYEDIVEAESEEKAKEWFWECGACGDSDMGELVIDSIEEITDDLACDITRFQDDNIRG